MSPESIGKRYGESIDSYAKASSNTVEQILIDYANESVTLMQKLIRRKVRTKGASTLAQSIMPMPAKVSDRSIDVEIISEVDYWQYRDLGVKGVNNKGKAPQSPFSFRTIGAGKKMINSFKSYIANTGSKSISGAKLIRKNKRVQKSLIEREATKMAVYTKIGGIAPLNFSNEAINSKRVNKLTSDIADAIGSTIEINILKKWQ